LGFRGDHAAGFAGISAAPWDSTEINCQLIHLFREKGKGSIFEPLDILNAIGQRAFALGCQQFYILSVEADLTPFARRMGAKPCGSVHVLKRAA
jgi:hypothetical protein